jgi:integrase
MECVPGVLSWFSQTARERRGTVEHPSTRLVSAAGAGGIVDEAGRGRYTWHSYVTSRVSLIDRGATPEVMVEMGHSSVTMTFNTYGHLFPDGRTGASNGRRNDRDLIPPNLSQIWHKTKISR